MFIHGQFVKTAFASYMYALPTLYTISLFWCFVCTCLCKYINIAPITYIVAFIMIGFYPAGCDWRGLEEVCNYRKIQLRHDTFACLYFLYLLIECITTN